MAIAKSYNKLPGILDKLRPAVSQAVEASAIAIKEDVKGGGPHAAPIRTGRLRRSYGHRRIDDSGLVYEVGNDTGIAYYAIYVELGTRRMAPRPHLVPAAEAERPRLAERVGRAIEDIMR